MTTGTHYDVIIIGSGAGGGTLAHALGSDWEEYLDPGTRRLRSTGESELGFSRRERRREVPDEGTVA